MITLKLATYNQDEVKTLTTMLHNATRDVELCLCHKTSTQCENCRYRHLCIDLQQSYLYAKEYQPIRN